MSNPQGGPQRGAYASMKMTDLKAQHGVDAANAVANANMADFLDPSFEGRLAEAMRFVMVDRSVELGAA